MSLEFQKLLNSEQKLSQYINLSKSLTTNNYEKKIRIAILGSFTLNGLAEVLQVKCSDVNIDCISYMSNYNQYNQDLLNESSPLYKFSPDITFLILDTRSIMGELFYLPYSASITDRKFFVEQKIQELKNLIDLFVERSKSKLIITNFVIPTYSPYGIFESKIEYSLQDMVMEINSNLENFIRSKKSVFWYDFNGFVTRYGENNVFDYHKYFFGDIKISFDYIPHLGHDLMRYIKGFLGISRKCIVLDLDNTLWGGIVGEDEFEGIQLGPTPPGNSYVEFQKRLLALYQRGIILTINSKNNLDDALQVIKKHPGMILREEHFALMKINWNDKITNMKEIASELNIGLDSMVFFDDDPVNREFVRTNLPQVLTVDMNKDPVQYPALLMNMNDFDLLQITEDDIKRGQMYLEEKNRKSLLESTSSLNDFLKKLDITIQLKTADKFTIPRISQLTLKTNQFNLTTKRYQEEDIQKFAADDKMIVGCVHVSDKFGDNGITGVYIVNKESTTEWIIDTFLLSCRIMGRGIENGIISSILQKAKQAGVKKVKAQLIKTQKNQPIMDFLPTYGFVKEGDYWVFSLENEIKTPPHLTIETK